MSHHEFEAQMSNVFGQMNDVPDHVRRRLDEVAQVTRERQAEMRKTVEQLQESLDYLRLSIKYLVFDLEATRRENKCLRDLIKNMTEGPESE